MPNSTPKTSAPQDQQSHGGRTTTTGNGIAHVAPGCNAPAAIVPELLTTKQAAELCGVGERTYWAWSRSGLAPPPVYIGLGTRPACRHRRSGILAWIKGGCKPVDGRAD